jgi:hypothetical protein
MSTTDPSQPADAGPPQPAHFSDNAPWWVKEIRIYGISGMVALAASFGLWRVYENSRMDAKASADRVVVLVEKGQTSLERNTDAYYKVAQALNHLDSTIREAHGGRLSAPTPDPEPREAIDPTNN